MTKVNTGNQDIFKATSLSIPAPSNSITKKIAAKVHAVDIDMAPLAKWRFAVRGFSASMFLSMILFKVIANPLAPTAATRTQAKSISGISSAG